MEVKQQLSDFEVSAIQTDAIWVSGIPRLRVFFTNIKPCQSSTEEKKSPWSIKVAEEAVRLEWESLYDSGELNEASRQYGRKLGVVKFTNCKNRLHTPRKGTGSTDNFWRHSKMKAGTSWPLGLISKELLMGYRKGYFSDAVPHYIESKEGHQMLGDAWCIPQVVERMKTLQDIFPRNSNAPLDPYFWE
jgi:hypothetical protein